MILFKKVLRNLHTFSSFPVLKRIPFSFCTSIKNPKGNPLDKNEFMTKEESDIDRFEDEAFQNGSQSMNGDNQFEWEGETQEDDPKQSFQKAETVEQDNPLKKLFVKPADDEFIEFLERAQAGFHQESNEELIKIGDQFLRLIELSIEVGVDKAQLELFFQFADFWRVYEFKIDRELVEEVRVERISDQSQELKRIQNLIFTTLLQYPDAKKEEYSNEYYACLKNNLSKTFSLTQKETIIEQIKQDLPNIPTSALLKLVQVYKNYRVEFVELVMAQFEEKRMRTASLSENLLICRFLNIKAVKSNKPFCAKFFYKFCNQFKEMNELEVMTVLTGIQKVDLRNSPIVLSKFLEAVSINIDNFNIFHIEELLQYYMKSQIVDSEKYSKDDIAELSHKLMLRKQQLKKELVRRFVNWVLVNQHNCKLVENQIVDDLTELSEIESQVDYFKFSQLFTKLQSSKIINSIIEDHRYLDQAKSRILNYQISNFQIYSGILSKLRVKDREVLLQLSEQFQNQYQSLNLSIQEELEIMKYFIELDLLYPFLNELADKILERIKSNAMKTIHFSQWTNYVKFSAYLTLYGDKEKAINLVNIIEPLLIELLRLNVNIKSKVNKSLEYFQYMPENTLKTLMHELVINNYFGIYQKDFYKIMSIIMDKGLLSMDFILKNSTLNNLFESSKAFYFLNYKNKLNYQRQISQQYFDVTFSKSLAMAVQKFKQENISVIAKQHLVGVFSTDIILQTPSTTLHIDIIQLNQTFLNSPKTPHPFFRLKQQILEGHQIQYEQIYLQELNNVDRDQFAQAFIDKHFISPQKEQRQEEK